MVKFGKWRLSLALSNDRASDFLLQFAGLIGIAMNEVAIKRADWDKLAMAQG